MEGRKEVRKEERKERRNEEKGWKGGTEKTWDNGVIVGRAERHKHKGGTKRSTREEGKGEEKEEGGGGRWQIIKYQE
jgi:hypothetical protein